MNKIISCTLVFTVLLLFAGVLFGTDGSDYAGQVQELTLWSMETEEGAVPVSLPYTLDCSAQQPVVTLCAEITPGMGEYLYLKTVYTPVEVYADGELLFAYGQEGTYPAFLLDPPTMVTLIPLPESARPLTLRLQFGAPSQRNTMTCYPILLGESGELLVYLFSQMGFSMFFAIVQIALGFLLLLTALFLIRFGRAGMSILWLGLFSCLVGVWMLGECNLSGIFIQNPPLLYLMAFTGMFTMVIPLIRCGTVILKPRMPAFLRWLCMLMELAVIMAVLLQMLGIAAFSRTMYLFHVLIPLSFFLFAGYIFWEAFFCRNPSAAHFFLPSVVLTIFAFLELANYHLFHMVQISFFFQLGVLIFVVMMCILCGHSIRQGFLTQEENRRLAYELSLIGKQMEIQKKQYAIFSETADSVRKQRHDLRHHLAVIRGYQEQHLDKKLTEYLDMLTVSFSVDERERICENDAVNAVAGYYLSMAEKAGIHSVVLQMNIPPDTERVQETDLCVIIGNLLENAITACKGTDPEQAFIHMYSRIRYGILTITMDNTYRTVHLNPDGTFQSQKAEGGIGLRSISAVAEKYGGNARFEAGQVFSSSVYLYLRDV